MKSIMRRTAGIIRTVSADNRSWNCGAEGETDDPEILRLRKRLRKNAYAVLIVQQGSCDGACGG